MSAKCLIPYSIQDIPVEVLLYTFHCFLGPKRDNGYKPGSRECFERRQRPIMLSHICSTWRSITLSDPSLWTDVLIDGPSKLYFSFLERSRPSLANLTIIADRGLAHKQGLLTFLELKFKAHSGDLDRIKSITLLVRGQDDEATEMLRPIRTHPLPALSSLDIRASLAPHGGGMGHAVHDVFRLLTRPPQALESISITGFCLKCVPNRAALHTLELRKTRANLLMSSSTIRGIFESSPVLETLILGPIRSHDWGEQDGKPIHAPSLKNLIIVGPNTLLRDDGRASPLDDLVVWNLRYLEATCATFEAIDRCRTLILQRVSRSNNGQGGSRPLTLMLNGLFQTSLCHAYERVMAHIPMDAHPYINLHIYPRYPPSEGAGHYRSFNVGILDLRSFVLYFDTTSKQSMHRLGVVPREMRRLTSRRGTIPLVIHSATEADASNLDGMETTTRWPYFDPVAVRNLAPDPTPSYAE